MDIVVCAVEGDRDSYAVAMGAEGAEYITVWLACMDCGEHGAQAQSAASSVSLPACRDVVCVQSVGDTGARVSSDGCGCISCDLSVAEHDAGGCV